MFDDGLRQAMRRETGLFVDNIIREHRSVLELLDADYTFVNERLARFYGIPGVTGPEFRRVNVSAHRSRRRHPVARQRAHGVILFHPHVARCCAASGSWRICSTLRLRLRLPVFRRSRKARARIRNAAPADGGAPQESGLRVLPFAHGPAGVRPGEFQCDRRLADAGWQVSGRRIRRAARRARPSRRRLELKALLVQDRDAFVRCLIEKLLTYALGRGLERYDRPAAGRDHRQAAVAGLPVFANWFWIS